MNFGPTSLQLSSVLARRLHRPTLRSDLTISKQILAGEVSYVVKIPETGEYSRYNEYVYEMLTLCDGMRTPAEMARVMMERHPDEELDEAQVVEFLEGMDPNTWERSVGEKNLAILEKIRQERNNRVNRASLLYIYFSAWDPDRILERIHPWLKWMFTRGFVIFSILLFFLNFVIVAADWDRIRGDTLEFYNFANKTAYDIWIFWVLLLFISAVHEFGHGLACKHFGGEVHQMGFMLIYFTPSFYTDCTDMHLFDRSSKRLWTIFAGMWIEMVVCGFATLAWYLLPPGSFSGDLSYKLLLLTGVSGIFINMNPLMKFDGYFALSQFLEIDNLREDAFAYLKAWVARVIFRQDVELPAVGERRQRIYLAYASAAFAYGTLILTIVTKFLVNVFTSRFGNWGYLMAGGCLYLLMRKRLMKWLPGWLEGLRKAKEAFMARQFTAAQKIGAAVVAGVALFFPVRSSVTTEFILEPVRRAEVRAAVAGIVTEVRVREGESVQQDAAVGALRNPEIELRERRASGQRRVAELTLAAARLEGNLGAVQQQAYQVERFATEQQHAAHQAAALILRAPISGIVTTPRVEQRAGVYLAPGDTLLAIADRSEMRARILVRDWELEHIAVGADVRLQALPYSLRTFSGTVREIMPAAAQDRPVSDPHKLQRKGQELTNYMAVVLLFRNSEGLLVEGMTGTAKVYGPRQPLVLRAGKGLLRWISSQVW